MTIDKRTFLHGIGTCAAGANTSASFGDEPSSLLIRGGTVLTMDDALGDFAQGDVLIRAGKIVTVGKQLDAGDAAVLDARGLIVPPGLIDTHWQMWKSLARSHASK